MAHTALARQYRPRTFAEVSAQRHVSETLRRAVSTNRVGHAYLFCGPRGIGKTTVARVLAMALNCPDRTPDGEPCGSCESCSRIWSGHTALDVVEIDAASNRGVDDARDLRERAMYAPSEEDRYKVYIVDEAHMLTREAWNALLKILEEPPPRVIFVFATTEPGRIERAAAPILSRCQRFDFRRIGTEDIVARLAEVLREEGEAEAPEEALRSIARRAEGGMRDALSLLDQVLALTDGQVETAAVRTVLGLVEEERFLRLLSILEARDHAEVFEFFEALESEGYDLVEFHTGFVDVLRGLLRDRLAGSTAEGVGGSFSPGDLLRMMRLASELDSSGRLRRTGHPRLLLELMALQLSHLDRTVELDEVLAALTGAGVEPPTAPTRSRERPRTTPEVASEPAPVVSQDPPPPPPPPTPSPPDEVVADRPPPTAPGGTPTAPGGTPTALGGTLSPIDAWDRLLTERKGLPRGLSPLLRALAVKPDGDERLTVDVPAGPLRERLGEPQVRQAIDRGLSELAGRPVSLRIDGDPAAEPGSRITRESVREDRLREEVKREPLLAKAVEELDLEPVD